MIEKGVDSWLFVGLDKLKISVRTQIWEERAGGFRIRFNLFVGSAQQQMVHPQDDHIASTQLRYCGHPGFNNSKLFSIGQNRASPSQFLFGVLCGS